jgi:type II secretory pathway pseudopilin PulG
MSVILMAIIHGMQTSSQKLFKVKGTCHMCLFLRAFTISEVLVSLLIFLMIISLSMPWIQPDQEDIRIDTFYALRNTLYSLSDDTLYVDQEGLWHEETLMFKIKQDEYLVLKQQLYVIIIEFQLRTGEKYEMVLPKI